MRAENERVPRYVERTSAGWDTVEQVEERAGGREGGRLGGGLI